MSISLFGFELKRSKPAKITKPNPLLNLIFPQWASKRGVPAENDFTALLKTYKEQIYTCSNRNAVAVAQATIRLYVAKPSKKVKCLFDTKSLNSDEIQNILSQPYIKSLPAVKRAIEFEEVLDHPILDLLDKVNPFMNGFDLKELTQLYQELIGNAYWLLVNGPRGYPVEIWPIPPDKMSVIPDPNRFITGYRYLTFLKEYTFPEQDIIHFKMMNPRNLYYGQGPVQAVLQSNAIFQNMGDYEQAVFGNMGRIEGAFQTDDSLDEEDFNRLKQEIQDNFYGAKNAGKTPLLDKGLKYVNYGMTPREMAYMGGREKIKESIILAFGQTLGMYDKSATRANADAANYNYAKTTVQPRCIRFVQKLNEKLVPKFDQNLFLTFEDVVPEDQAQALKIRTEHVRTGIISINEARKGLRLPPFEHGDQPLVQIQYIPLNMVAEGANMRNPQSTDVQVPTDEKPPKPANEKPSDKPKPQNPPKDEKPKPKPPAKSAEEVLADILQEKLTNVG
jgi:HK97 family phage portal protein